MKIGDLLDDDDDGEDDEKESGEGEVCKGEESVSFLKLETPSDPYEALSKQINSITIDTPAQKEAFIKSGLLLQMLQHCEELRFPEVVTAELLEMMLPLMENDPANQQLLATYLSQPQIVQYLQTLYLSH